MQLTIEVLPAPLGPIIENSSPWFTPKLTSVSARTPPKRRDTPRTSKACSTHSLRKAYLQQNGYRFCDQNTHNLAKAPVALFCVRPRPRSTRFIPIGQPCFTPADNNRLWY